jgi:hypothetical protein
MVVVAEAVAVAEVEAAATVAAAAAVMVVAAEAAVTDRPAIPRPASGLRTDCEPPCMRRFCALPTAFQSVLSFRSSFRVADTSVHSSSL